MTSIMIPTGKTNIKMNKEAEEHIDRLLKNGRERTWHFSGEEERIKYLAQINDLSVSEVKRRLKKAKQ